MKFTAATVAAILATSVSATPAASKCPAPGKRDAQGRYSCNPAHKYPAGQICGLQDGCYFLRRPGPGVKAPAPDSFKYEVQSFTEIKQNGKDLSNVYFELKNVNSQAKAIACSPYDPATGKTTTTFDPKNVYFCGKDSPFSFAYNPDYGVQTNELYVWQDVGKGQSLGGKAVFSDPICRAGGNGALRCTIPQQQKIDLTVAKL